MLTARSLPFGYAIKRMKFGSQFSIGFFEVLGVSPVLVEDNFFDSCRARDGQTLQARAKIDVHNGTRRADAPSCRIRNRPLFRMQADAAFVTGSSDAAIYASRAPRFSAIPVRSRDAVPASR